MKTKEILKPYTEEETKTIYNLWYDGKTTMEERTNYALSIGRTFTQCASKASYEKTKRLSGKPLRLRRPPLTLLPFDGRKQVAEVSVTKVIKGPIRNAIINIGNIKIEIPSKTFYVDGIKIDW